MKQFICLLMAVALLLTGCGGSTSAETEAPATEPKVTTEPITEPTTEPTTVPTEPKTFFEEQGFEFWEGFTVAETLDEEGNLDGGLFAEANILDATECHVTITSGNREEKTYRLADTGVTVFIDEYKLSELDEAFEEKKLVGTTNIKNASDNFYKAFKEEDSGLTKEAWLEKYQDYKVIHCRVAQRIRTSHEVNNAMLAMNIGQSKWSYSWSGWIENVSLMNSADGSVYGMIGDDHPGVAETFTISTETGSAIMCAVADLDITYIDSTILAARDGYLTENLFVMLPADTDNLVFVLPLVGTGRTLEKLEEQLANEEVSENAWEQKTFAEYTEGKDHLKYYFLSPDHH